MTNILVNAPFHFIKVSTYNKNKNIKFFLSYQKKNRIYKDFAKYHGLIVDPGANYKIDKKYLSKFKNLKIIVTPSTGVNHIDLEYCLSNNIVVKSLINNRKYLEKITASAEFTFFLIMSSIRKIKKVNSSLYKAKWRLNENELRGRELFNKKVGIIGLGRIGKKLQKYLYSFETKTIFYDPYVQKYNKKYIKKTSLLKKIFKECDIICICCYLTEETKDLINYNYLKLLKKDSVLVNSARGEIVVEKDLLRIIKERKDIYVSLDVLRNEQNNIEENILFKKSFKLPNLYITPHIAGLTYESQNKAGIFAIKEINKFFKSK